VLILFIFALIIKLQALHNPVAPVLLPDAPTYNLLVYGLGKVIGGSPFGFTLIASLMLFCQALYLNAITVKHRLFLKTTYLPAFYFLLLTSIFPGFSQFNNFIFVNWFLLVGVDIILSFTQPVHPRKYIFNAGFIVAVGALFQFSVVIYLLLVIVALLLMRPFSLAEWTVALLGAGMVVYFFSGVLFLTDSTYLFKRWFQFQVDIPDELLHKKYYISLGICLLVLIGCGLYAIQTQLSKSTIFVKRVWAIVICYLFISIPVAIFAPLSRSASLLVALPALVLIVVQPLYLEKRKWFSNFIFYFSLVLLVFCQVVVNK
jgi:hypothetical protein